MTHSHIILAVLLTVTGAQGAGANNMVIKEVSKGIENWSKVSGVVITDSARKKLFVDAQLARNQVLSKNSSITPEQLNNVTAKSIAAFLDRSQQNKQSASLALLMEQYATGAGLVLPSLTDYPTLVIQVNPPQPDDFVVAIDQVPYPAGSTMFRVTEGSKQVQVERAHKKPCTKTIKVTRTGPNVVVCDL